jgi:undecaprenyl-diphosphatase
MLALVPGMSRSGATISGGMLLGLSREGAARFSFLLSLPIILGSGLKKLLELGGAGVPVHEWYMIALAAGVALASGLAAIHYLLKFLREHTLVPFVVYRVALAVGVLAFL